MRATESLVIVNPRSQGGRTARRWHQLEPKLRAALGPLRVEWTRARGDAERVAREGARAGTGNVIVVGGDGTASEVVTGLLTSGLTRPPAVGLLPLGTGSDLSRALGFHRDVDGAVAAIASGTRRRVDAGCVSGAWDGREATRYFLNIASFGVTGDVDAALARRDERSRRGPLSYAAGALGGIARWTSPSVRIAVDGRVVHDAPLVFAATANGRYFGGGMFVAPEAELDDGLFDIVIVGGMSRAQLVRRFPALYRGTHLSLPGVTLLRGRRVDAEAPAPVRVEADGEALCTLPARIDVVPGALDLLGVRGTHG